MPQFTQQSQLCFLLMWTTAISVIQVVLFILIFTQGCIFKMGHSEPTPGTQRYTTSPQLGIEKGVRLDKGKMLSFRAVGASSTVQWMTKSQTPGLISEAGAQLTVRKGGYYFLSLRVTLTSCEEVQLKRTVSLKLNNDVILLGWIDPTTNSTGLISKVEEVSTGETLMVTINPPAKCFNDNDVNFTVHVEDVPLTWSGTGHNACFHQ